jgi:hypothetical protein
MPLLSCRMSKTGAHMRENRIACKVQLRTPITFNAQRYNRWLDSTIGHGTYSQPMPAEYDPKVDYYAVLCVEATATTADIKKAHRAPVTLTSA